MSLLARPPAGAGATDVPTDEGAEVAAPRRRRTRFVVAAALGLGAAWACLPLYGPRLEQGVTPELSVDAGLLINEYGADGTYALRYRHGEPIGIRVPVGNRGPLPLTIETASLDSGEYPLLVPTGDNLPLTVGPWEEQELSLEFVFDNCRYYHERSAETYTDVALSGSVLGRGVDTDLELDFPIALHGQVILDCPDRTLRRDDDHPLRR